MVKHLAPQPHFKDAPSQPAGNSLLILMSAEPIVRQRSSSRAPVNMMELITTPKGLFGKEPRARTTWLSKWEGRCAYASAVDSE
ncbi:hypothetical protein B566_EDAN003106 [Ephemera danica]|nr:hypothetical protein B566_EDAN003106 [Ephemera danica]